MSKRNTFSGPGQITFLLDFLTKGLYLIEESGRVRITGITAKSLEEVKATRAIVDLILHEMGTIFFCQVCVSIRSDAEALIQQVFDLCPCIFILLHIVPMFVYGRPSRIVVVPRLDKFRDERVDL